MKKLSFFLMAMLFSVMSFATEVTVTIGDYAAANGWTDSKQYTSLTMDEVVTVTANPTTGTNTAKYYVNGNNWRMYQNEAPAIVVTAAEGYLLTSVTFTYESNKTGVMLDADSAQVASGTAVALGNVASATFTVGNTSASVTNGQVRITAITVVYEAAAEEKPVITAAELEQITGDEEIFHFYLSQGVAVDKNPESPYYGYTYVTAATDGADDGSSDRADTQKRGIFVFDAELNSLNPDNVGFLPANADSLMTDVSRQAMHRIAVNPVNNHVVFCYNVAGASAIWSMDPANLAGDAVNLIEGLAITKANAFCFDAEGTLYVMDNANTSDGGTIVKVVNGELDTVAKNTIWGVQDISLASDGRGGLWVAQNRWAVDAYAVLSHVNAAGEVDFAVTGSSSDEVKALFPNDFNASYRGQCAYNVEKDILAFGGNKVVTLFYVTYDAAGAPSIAKIGATPAIGSNIDGVDFYANGDMAVVSASAERFKKFAVKYQIEIKGVVKRAIQYNDATIVLTHEENGTAHLYKVVDGVAVAELSQKGVIAVDPENAGDFLAISDIALTEDGKLVATNKIVCQASDNEVDAGYKRGELRAYIWNDLAGAPSLWFTSKMSSNWYRSIQGNTIAYKGTSTNGTLFTTGITATGVKFRYSVYNVIDGVYTDPAVNDSEHYHFTKGSAQTTDVLGANYQLVASPLAATNWILDAELVDPFEIVDPLTYNTEVTANPALAIDLGKKYNGTSIVTVGEQHLMVAPYATAEGLLAGVKVVDITAGLAAATEVATANLAAAVEATAAATAVAVAENVLTITLVADATIHTLEVVLEKEPEIEWIEMPLEIANLTTEEMEVEGAKYLLLQGRDDMNGAEVMLFLNNYTGEEKAYEVNVENSFMTFGGTELTIMDGSITKSVDPELGDVFAGIVHASAVEEGVTLYVALDLKMYAQPAIEIAIEDVEITVNEESATAFFKATWESSPLQVEVSGFEEVESKEYSECWLSIGDNVNWVDAAAGPAAITIKDGVASLVGTFTSYATGKTYEVTLSGKLPQDPGSGLDNVQVDAKAVKVIKNGMLIINRDGKEYNVQGAILK